MQALRTSVHFPPKNLPLNFVLDKSWDYYFWESVKVSEFVTYYCATLFVVAVLTDQEFIVKMKVSAQHIFCSTILEYRMQIIKIFCPRLQMKTYFFDLRICKDRGP